MRRHRWTTLTLPVNWKVVQEAFNEGYHIGQTHESGVNYRPAKTPSRAHGMHAMLVMEYTGFGEYKTASGKWKMPENTQEFIWASSQHLYKSLTGLVNEPGAVAAQRLLDLPADIAPEAALHYLRQFHREEYEKRGAPLPETLTPEAEAAGGVDWHIFPNSIFLPAVDGGIWYRSRPNGNDPDSCIFDIWWFGRYAPGAEPAVQQEVFHGFEAFRGQCEFLEEDFKNLGAVAKGMKSRGWKGARTNPVTEVPVNNFHKVLRRFLFPDEQSPKKLLRRSKKKTAKNRR